MEFPGFIIINKWLWVNHHSFIYINRLEPQNKFNIKRKKDTSLQ